jgi:hypothetical protein
MVFQSRAIQQDAEKAEKRSADRSSICRLLVQNGQGGAERPALFL